MAALNANYFAALSISSLASDDRSVSIDGDGSYLSHSAIYQQLSNIEEMAANFITRKPTVLDFKHDVYAELEYDHHECFEFLLSNLVQQEAICISIKCLPNFTVGEPLSFVSDKVLLPGVDHCALVFNLERRSGTKLAESIPFKASLINGEYSILLSHSASMLPGTYVLSVGLADVASYPKNAKQMFADVHAVQAIRVHCAKNKTVRSIPLEAGITVTGTATGSEMCYYRFVASDPNHMISITAAAVPLNTGSGSGSGAALSDPDVYVTNRYGGQLPVSRENSVWSSVTQGSSRLEILPTDINLPTDVKDGRIFLIGVAGNGVEDAPFALTVTTSLPPPCTVFNFAPLPMAPPSSTSVAGVARDGGAQRTIINCAERGCTVDTTLVEGEYLHFAVQLPDCDNSYSAAQGSNAGKAGNIVVLVHDAPSLASIAHATVVQQCSVSDLIAAEQVNLHSGCGVHAGDTLAAQGLLDDPFQARVSGPGSPAGLWPVVYASADVLHPCREFYTWRASSSQGKALMLINPLEWRYERPLCYFSVYGHTTTATAVADAVGHVDASSGAKKAKKAVRVSVWRMDSAPALTRTQQLSQEIVTFLYERVDGQVLSLADRRYDAAQALHLRAQDDGNVTYFETEYVAMVQLLQTAGATHGQVFYDLGCGTGKALVAAALSGIRFVKCVGVELLPTLANAAQQAVGALAANHHTASLFRTPLPAAASSSHQGQGLQDSRIKSRLDHLNIPLPTMEVWLDSLLSADWSDADFVYAASLCFSDALVHQLLAAGARLRVGARLATLKLTENYHQWFVLEKTVPVQLSCGVCPAYVLVRSAPPTE